MVFVDFWAGFGALGSGEVSDYVWRQNREPQGVTR